MSLSIGIVGLPNVGKSTLFTALTNKGGLAANYPFATIEPNVGIVAVPDKRLDELAKIDNPAKIVPATVEFVDIAGLVAGASQGEGLGNQFLANIRETDAIAEVVRFFSDSDVTHVSGKVDPYLRRGDHQDRAHLGRHRHGREGSASFGEGSETRQSVRQEVRDGEEGSRGLERGASRPYARP